MLPVAWEMAPTSKGPTHDEPLSVTSELNI
jgi:hypothetical protein